jgi:hypothetical protein
MALARTTLSAAVAAGDQFIVVASATSVAAGSIIRVDDERMTVTKAYVLASTTVPVLRGQDGSSAVAHVASAGVVHGIPSDWGGQEVQTSTNFPIAGRPRRIVSVTASSTLTLPLPGEDLFVILNGTSVITLTVPVPTKDLDGCRLTICGNGAAAHALTFTGGLSGAGSNYDAITVNATAPIAVDAIACNSLWNAFSAIPIAGTVTNVTGSIA